MILAKNSPLVGIPDGHPKGGRGVWGGHPRNPDGGPLKTPYFVGIPRNPDEIKPCLSLIRIKRRKKIKEERKKKDISN